MPKTPDLETGETSLTAGETATFSPELRRDAPSVDDPVLPRGATLGRYVVLDLLGEGGMGRVYSTYDPKLDRKVAVKLLRPGVSAAQEREQRLLREARALARLSHPNVITLYDVTVVEGRVLLAMEWVRGVTLQTWLTQEPRNADAILEVFLQAGEGLAASHRAGLVHRDFKTSNVLVSDEGRVVVLDFGLARATEPGPVEAAGAIEDQGAVEDGSTVVDLDLLGQPQQAPLDAVKTRTGAVLGTPAYMAPEQRAGGPVGPAADQYSFCVALYQALYGRHPDSGAGGGPTFDPVPFEGRAHNGLPAAVDEALQRGLATDPNQRYPTLQHLLRDLEAKPQPRSGLAVGLTLAGLVVITVLILGSPRFQDTAAPCQSARGQLDAVWNPATVATLGEVFANSGVPFANAAWRATRGLLDAYGDAWVAQHTEICEATHVRGEQSLELLDRRMACLDHRRRDLDALVDLLAEGDPAVLRRAPRAALALSALEHCDDTQALLTPQPEPLDPALQQQVDALRTRLSQSKARHDAGRYQQALDLAQGVAEEAETLDAWSLIAEAQLRAGIGHGALDDAEAATEALERSLLAAQVAQQPRLAAEAVVRRVRVAGYQQRRFDEAHRLARHAEVLIDRLDRGETLRASLDDYLGAVALQEGQLETAAERHGAALRIRRRQLGERHAEVARTLTRLGSVRSQQGKLAEALTHYEQALDIHRSLYGEDHPVVSHALDQVGSAAFNLGDYLRAQTLHERALAIHRWLDRASEDAAENGAATETSATETSAERSTPTTEAANPAVAHTLSHLGNVTSAQGDLERATDYYREALTIYQEAYGPEHPNVAVVLSNLGLVSYEAGEGLQALDDYQRALAIQEDIYGPDHPWVAMTVFNRAGVELYLLDRFDAALGSYERAIATWREVHGDDFYLLGSAQVGRGVALHHLGRSAEGLAVLEAAVRALEEHSEEVGEIANGRFELARLLHTLGREPERARRLAQAAYDLLADQPAHRKLAGTIEAWLREPTAL